MKLEQMTGDDWRALAYKAHRIAVANGFYEQAPSIKGCRMLAICSLTDAVEAERKGRRSTADEWMDNCSDNLAFHAGYNHHIKGTLEDELAEFVIRCLVYVAWRSKVCNWEDIEISLDCISPAEWKEVEGITEMAYYATERMFVSVPYALELVLSYCKFAGIDIMRYVEIKLRYTKILLLWRRKKH